MSTTGEQFDVVVIGAGTAGLAAAKAAHSEGARVALVDHGPLGTLCARKGCMPSKIILRSTDALVRARRLARLGVRAPGEPTLDWPVVRERQRTLVREFVDSIVRQVETSKHFTLLRGSARFSEAGELQVDGDVAHGGDGRTHRLTASSWVIAAGSLPVLPPIEGLRRVPFLTSDDVFDLEAIPQSIAVIGAGAIGVELGQFLARAGAEVHLIGESGAVAGLSEGALLDTLLAPLGRELELHRWTRVQQIRPDAGSLCVELKGRNGSSELRVATVLVAAGRRPNLEGLGLDRMGVRLERGVPVHDEFMKTTNPAVFVAGDAAGPPALLHTASLQGRAAGRNAAAGGALKSPALEPGMRIVFSDPQVATVGLDPHAARAAGYQACVARRLWNDQGKAKVLDETDGMAQLVVDRKTGRVLGCQLVGYQADLLVHLISYAMHFAATVDDLLNLHHYHPTLVEMIPSLARLAVEQLHGKECQTGEVAAAIELQ